MCGRKTLTRGKLEIIEELSVDEWTDDFTPGFNIVPTQINPVLRTVNHKRVIKPMKWGLIPTWSKDISFASKMINARCETLSVKPAFRRLLGNQRCVSITDGYFEWQKTTSGTLPHYIRRKDGKLLLLAALWDAWKTPESSVILSYTVITCAASPVFKFIHERMPVIIPPGRLSDWLDGTHTGHSDAMSLLTSNDEGLIAYPVSAFVNNVRNNSPKCIEPLT